MSVNGTVVQRSRVRILVRMALVCAQVLVLTLGAVAQPSQPASTYPVIDSVNKATLARYFDQTVRAQGIIGSYIGDKNKYRFTMDDGSNVAVIGRYPDMGGTHWTITARVQPDGSGYVLKEMEPKVPDDPAHQMSTTPLIVAGLALILAAVAIVVVVVVMNSRAAVRMSPPIIPRAQPTPASLRPSVPGNHGDVSSPPRYSGSIGGRSESSIADRRKTVLYNPADSSSSVAATPRAAPPTISAKPPANKPAAATIAGIIGELVVLSGPDAGKTFPISKSETSIGRENTDVVLSDDSVSRSHARISIKRGDFMIVDNDSSFGTMVGDVRLGDQPQQIVNGDLIRFGNGNTVIKFVTPGENFGH
ncbi:MAG: FHA domain-containing protein [Capsulimonadaceae bacterium]